ncbi:MAG: hypothetical protein IT308_09070 [Anaerolineaceae bacterium]|nr:hypothetical protein [Anaerolineaceae bacterium]
MKLNAPKQVTWWIALILGALGLIASLVTVPVLSGLALWLLVIGWALLLVATVTKGL